MSTINIASNAMNANPGLCGKKPLTMHLSYGMAIRSDKENKWTMWQQLLPMITCDMLDHMTVSNDCSKFSFFCGCAMSCSSVKNVRRNTAEM
jgi:hypothetical protein